MSRVPFHVLPSADPHSCDHERRDTYNARRLTRKSGTDRESRRGQRVSSDLANHRVEALGARRLETTLLSRASGGADPAAVARIAACVDHVAARGAERPRRRRRDPSHITLVPETPAAPDSGRARSAPAVTLQRKRSPRTIWAPFASDGGSRRPSGWLSRSTGGPRPTGVVSVGPPAPAVGCSRRVPLRAFALLPLPRDLAEGEGP
jgi:hypothetical protein